MITSFYKTFFSNFEIYQTPPDIHEAGDIKNTLEYLVKPNASIGTLTRKSSLKSDKILQFDQKSFSTTVIKLSPYWDYKHVIDYISRK